MYYTSIFFYFPWFLYFFDCFSLFTSHSAYDFSQMFSHILFCLYFQFSKIYFCSDIYFIKINFCSNIHFSKIKSYLKLFSTSKIISNIYLYPSYSKLQFHYWILVFSLTKYFFLHILAFYL